MRRRKDKHFTIVFYSIMFFDVAERQEAQLALRGQNDI